MPRRSFLLLFMLFVVPILPRPTEAAEAFFKPKLMANQIEDLLGTQWYGVYFKDKKIGYARSSLLKKDDQYDHGFEMKLKLQSFGKKVQIHVKSNYRFDNQVPFRLMRGRSVLKDGSRNKIFEIRRKGDVFIGKSKLGNNVRTKKLGNIDLSLSDVAALNLWLAHDPKIGEKIKYNEYSLEKFKLKETVGKILSVKSSLVNGVKVKYFKIRSESTDGLPITSLHLQDGDLLSAKFAIFEIRKETEKEAKDTEFSQDLFVLGMVRINKPLGERKKISGIVIEVQGKNADKVLSGPRQRVIVKTPNKCIVKLGKRYGVRRKATAKEIKEALKETVDFPIFDKRIVKLAKEAVTDAKTPEEKVKRLVQFVKKFIRPKLAASMPSIFDLIEKPEGDCKSYSLLFTTLARAVGIPARRVSGLVYMGDDTKAFGGHAWNQVVLNGHWVPVDASMGQAEADATHVSFGDDKSSSKTLLSTFGELSFRLIKVEHEK